MADFTSAGGGDVSTDSIWAAAGDIVYATADDTASVLSVGSNNDILQLSSGIPAWTCAPSLAGLTVESSSDIDLTSTNNAACAIYIRANGGTSETIKIHADQGTAGGANCSASIAIKSDAGGINIDSGLAAGSAFVLNASGGGAAQIRLQTNGTGSGIDGSGCAAAIHIAPSAGGIRAVTAINEAGAMYLGTNAGTSETLQIHSDQGTGTGSICIKSDGGGITLNPGTFVTVGGIADGEIRIMEDSGAGTNYAAIKVQNMAASYTLTLPADDGCACEVLTTNGSGTLTWAAAGGQTINNATENELVTIGSTTTELDAEANLIFDGSKLFIGDDADGEITLGMTINQATNDDGALHLKSSDVNHGMTDYYEVDTYGVLQKAVAACGGLQIRGIMKCQDYATEIIGWASGCSGSRSNPAKAKVMINGFKICGTGQASPAADTNILAIRTGGSSRAFVTSNGDIYLDGTSNDSAWDEYCDVSLLTTYRAVLMEPEADFRNRFGDFIEENSKVLSDTKVIEFNDDGHHFFSVKGLNGLMIDSIRQLHGRIEGLEFQMKALGDGK